MRVRRFLHLVLLLGACGLVWLVLLTWNRSPAPLVIDPPSSLNPQLPVLLQARPETGKTLSRLITAKNLFSPDRRTAEEEAPKKEEEPPVPPPEHLKLVGVFLAGSRKEAFFTDSSKGGKVVRVTAGGALESYQLARIMPSEAVLTLGEGGEEVSLRMNVQKSIDAAKAPRIIPARPKPQGQAESQGGRPEGQAPQQQAALTYNSVLGGGSASTLVLGADATQAAASTASTVSGDGQDEALSIRQNIRQLQRRLREIRRDRARERRESRAEGRDE